MIFYDQKLQAGVENVLSNEAEIKLNIKVKNHTSIFLFWLEVIEQCMISLKYVGFFLVSETAVLATSPTDSEEVLDKVGNIATSANSSSPSPSPSVNANHSSVCIVLFD